MVKWKRHINRLLGCKVRILRIRSDAIAKSNLSTRPIRVRHNVGQDGAQAAVHRRPDALADRQVMTQRNLERALALIQLLAQRERHDLQQQAAVAGDCRGHALQPQLVFPVAALPVCTQVRQREAVGGSEAVRALHHARNVVGVLDVAFARPLAVVHAAARWVHVNVDFAVDFELGFDWLALVETDACSAEKAGGVEVIK